MDGQIRIESLLAATRISVGLGLLVLPRLGGRLWYGHEAERPPSRAIARWLGVRDIAVGLTLLRMRRQEPTRSTVFAEAAVVDVVDAATALAMRRRLPGSSWWAISAGGGLMALADLALALHPTLDRLHGVAAHG